MTLNGQTTITVTLVVVIIGVAVLWGAMQRDVAANCKGLESVEGDIDALPKEYVPREEVAARLGAIENTQRRMERKLDKALGED